RCIRQVVAENVLTEDDCVGVLMGQERAQVGTGLKFGVEIHHVAAVAVRSVEIAVEVAAAYKAVEFDLSASQPIKPAGEEDRKPAVAIHVQGMAEAFARVRINLVVEGGDSVLDRRLKAVRFGLVVIDVDEAMFAYCSKIGGDRDVAVRIEEVL